MKLDRLATSTSGTDFYEGSSIRAAYLTAFDATVDTARHSVIRGEAPRGIELRSTMTVPASGRFTWHVNPLRPSQYASVHLSESWTISCGPGNSGAKHRRGASGAGRDGVRRHERRPHGPPVRTLSESRR